MEKLCWRKCFSHAAFCFISFLICLSLSGYLKITDIWICFGDVMKKQKYQALKWKKATRHERRIVLRRAHIHVHRSCRIHKGNKPIGTRSASDLQLQLGSKERWVNFSTFRPAYWYSNRVGVKTGGSGSQFSSPLLCKSLSFSFNHKTFVSLLPSLNEVPCGGTSVPFSSPFSQLIEDWWQKVMEI